MKRPNKKQYDLAGYCIRYSGLDPNKHLDKTLKFDDGKVVPVIHGMHPEDLDKVIGYAKLKTNKVGVYCYITLTRQCQDSDLVAWSIMDDKNSYGMATLLDRGFAVAVILVPTKYVYKWTYLNIMHCYIDDVGEISNIIDSMSSKEKNMLRESIYKQAGRGI